MSGIRKDEKAVEMYDLYKTGHSLAEVAMAYDVSRQSVFGLFKSRNFEIRPVAKPKAFVEFNGFKYTIRNHGYFAKTSGNRTLLHRDVWEFYNGEIPNKFDIHHKDEDTKNNKLENLECLPKAERTRLYSPHNNQYTKGRKRGEKCGT